MNWGVKILHLFYQLGICRLLAVPGAICACTCASYTSQHGVCSCRIALCGCAERGRSLIAENEGNIMIMVMEESETYCIGIYSLTTMYCLLAMLPHAVTVVRCCLALLLQLHAIKPFCFGWFVATTLRRAS